jgi:hypothetical protein
MRDGLDVLAAYAEGGVRYVNHTGKLAVLDGVQIVRPLVERLFSDASALVAKIAPWKKARLPPPPKETIRLTLLTSDGLCFGQGPSAAMLREPLASPVLARATTLLTTIVGLVTQQGNPALTPPHAL